jgi:putative transposase
MPRRPRIHVPGGLYHAILRGNHREAIFHRPADYQAFEELVASYLERYEARLHAYCWMPNHVHLAVQVGRAPLGRLMQAVASVYARRKQRCVPTTGHLFERRYRAKLVQFDAYLLALVRYIHCNPVRAGLVSDPSEYIWSSHRAYLGLAPRSWLLTEPTFSLLGGGTHASMHVYRRFMGEEPDLEEIKAVRCGQDRSRLPRSAPVLASDFRGPRTAVPGSLEDLIETVAAELRIDRGLLASRRRDPDLVRARTEIARRAAAGAVATLAAVAARLGRAPSTLSELLNRQAGRHGHLAPDLRDEPKP